MNVSNHWLQRIVGFWSLLFLSTGCEFKDNSVKGELGAVSFTYVCVDQSDAHCRQGRRDFPKLLAVGGEFDLREDETFSSRDNIRSASPDMISESGGRFMAVRPGWSAMLIFESFGEIEDFFHLRAAEVQQLTISDDQDQELSQSTIQAGSDFAVSITPTDASGELLAGVLAYHWESSDDAVARVVVDSRSGRSRIDGIAEGTAILTVSFNEAEASLRLTVTPNPVLLDAGSVPGSVPSEVPSERDAAVGNGVMVDGGASPTRDAGLVDAGTTLDGPDAAMVERDASASADPDAGHSLGDAAVLVDGGNR